MVRDFFIFTAIKQTYKTEIMATVKPFKGLRPPKEIAKDLACLPYDVMNSEEAAKMAEGKECSLLHITRAEIDCPPGTDIHSTTVYEKSVENFKKFQEKGWLLQDDEPKFYIYAQTMDGRTQYGIVGGAACEDYHNGIIKKHELTRPDKEEDRMILTRYLNANIEPVFFSYKAVPEIDKIVENIVKNEEPEYDFVADEDGFGHSFWPVNDPELNKKIEDIISAETRVKKSSSGKSSYALTPSEKKLAGEFLNNKGKLPWPVERGFISGTFGSHPHPVLKHVMIKNNGIDIATDAHSDARAVFSGKVVSVTPISNTNIAVIIKHGSWFTVYSNLEKVYVKKGDNVATKEVLGRIHTNLKGKTELHFEVWKGKQKQNPYYWILRR